LFIMKIYTTWKQNWFAMTIAALFYLFLPLLPHIIMPTSLARLMSYTLAGWLFLGIVMLALRAVRQETIDPVDVFSSINYLLSFFLAKIAFFIIVLIGLIALIVPGVYMGIRLCLFPYYVIDGHGVIDSLKSSWHATRGQVEHMILIWLLLLLIAMVAGIVPFLLQVALLLLLYPLGVLAFALMYQKEFF